MIWKIKQNEFIKKCNQKFFFWCKSKNWLVSKVITVLNTLVVQLRPLSGSCIISSSCIIRCILMAATDLSRWRSQQAKWALQHFVITRFTFQAISCSTKDCLRNFVLPQYRLHTDFSKEAYAENLQRLLQNWAFYNQFSKVIFLCPIPIENCTYMKKFCAASI